MGPRVTVDGWKHRLEKKIKITFIIYLKKRNKNNFYCKIVLYYIVACMQGTGTGCEYMLKRRGGAATDPQCLSVQLLPMACQRGASAQR